jgi:small subunit ribosomal protein S2
MNNTNLKNNFNIQGLMDAGVHFGHRTMRWNAKMQPYIYGARNNIHIIDLQKTAPLLNKALNVAKEVASKNGRILFVATKRQASEIVSEAAEKCGQYYVNYRWMGGTLTNWGTVSQSIKTLNTLEQRLADPEVTISKKERLQNQRKVQKLNQALGGIRSMGGKPDLLFVIDTNRENIAILEARKLGIPVIAVVDTNCDPDGIDYIIPGNDDSVKSIRMFCNLMSEAIVSGLSKSLAGKVSTNKDEAEKITESSTEKSQKPALKAVKKKEVEMEVEDKDAVAEQETAKGKKKPAPATAKKKTAKK